ncbi:lipopolysaccharide biosynthesis protein [Leucobacter luti]|uniref:lipopolysaccharide biosynthesis protein n=1 Tax=Leucobacter luti TaxID=340320 RepID=UPI003CFF051C
MQKRKLVIFAVGPALSAALGLITLPLTAWIFEPDDIGRLNLLQTLIAVSMNLAFMGLDNAFVREFHEEDDRTSLYSTTMTPPLLLLGVLTLPVVLFPASFSTLVYGLDSAVFGYATVATLFLSLLIRQWALVARMNEWAITFTFSQVIPKLVTLAGLGTVALVATRPGFLVLALVLLLSLGVAGFYMNLATLRLRPLTSSFRIVWGRLVSLLKYGLPAMIAAFSFVAMSAIGPFSLRVYSDFHELGIYSVAVSIAAAVGVVQYSFNTVWGPAIFKANAAGRVLDVYPSALRAVCAIFAIVASGVALLSWVLPLLLPKEYAQIEFLLVGAALVPLLLMMRDAGGIGNNIARRMGQVAGASVVALLVCLLLSLALVPRFEAKGAVLASLFAMWALFVINAETAARSWISVSRATMHLVVGLAVMLATVTVWWGERLGRWHLLGWVVYAVAVVFYFRRDLRAMLVRGK